MSLSKLAELASVASSKNTKQVLSVSVDSVESKEQVRKEFNKIDELAASILIEGQQTPIIVSPMNDENKYIIQKGERRWRAIKEAGLKNIDVIVNNKEQTKAEEIAGELTENIQRENLTPLEIAHAIKNMLNLGFTREEISKKLGKSNSFVSSHLTLTQLPERVLELYNNDITKDVETLNNLRILNDINQDRCELVCSIALSEQKPITRKESRDLIKGEKEKSKRGKVGNYAPTPDNDSPTQDELAAATSGTSKAAEVQVAINPTLLNQATTGAVSEEDEEEPAVSLLETSTETSISGASTHAVSEHQSKQPVTIHVSVLTENDFILGTLLLKECDDPECVWVKLDSSGDVVKAKASTITIEKLEGSR